MLDRQKGIYWPKETVQSVLDLHCAGLTNSQISEDLDIPRKAIMDFLQHRKIKSNRLDKTLRVEGDNGICRVCEEPKPLSTFSEHKMKNGHMWRNSVCGRCKKRKFEESCFDSPERIFRVRIGALRKRASSKKWLFNLTVQHLLDIYEHQKGLCFYSDEKMLLEFGHRRDRSGLSLSVDRVCSSLGYVIGNIVLCTERVNRVKTDLSLAEIKAWLPGWFERIQNRKDWVTA